MELSIDGMGRQFDGGILFVAVHGTLRPSFPCPLHKMLHTLVKTHTVPPSHGHGSLLYVNFFALL